MVRRPVEVMRGLSGRRNGGDARVGELVCGRRHAGRTARSDAGGLSKRLHKEPVEHEFCTEAEEKPWSNRCRGD